MAQELVNDPQMKQQMQQMMGGQAAGSSAQHAAIPLLKRLDDKLTAKLLAGAILFVRADWLRSGGLERMLRRQDLEARARDTGEAIFIAPAAAAKEVVVKTRPRGPGFALSTDPPLNPYQPNQSNKTPIIASGKLWPGIGFTFPSSPYFPLRGPRMSTQPKAANPPKA